MRNVSFAVSVLAMSFVLFFAIIIATLLPLLTN